MARYIVKFVKGYGVKFISHLDLIRSVQRAIRRAGIPISYSKGFNPHAELSFATPLAVGTWSEGEYFDMKLDQSMEAVKIVEMLNKVLPQDIKVISAKKVGDEFPNLMSIVTGALYNITVVNIRGEIDDKILDKFMKRQSMEVTKQGKNGARLIDIKPMIQELHPISCENDCLMLRAKLSAGSRSNLNPELLVDAMKLYVKGFESAEIRDIKKLETYVEVSGSIKTPMEVE